MSHANSAFAVGPTRLTNIANQRVKECNRLRVTVEQLRACGFGASELDDGVHIDGQPDATSAGDATAAAAQPSASSLSAAAAAAALIACHDDHRIAMSFAVVGAVRPRVVITDKLASYSSAKREVEL